MDINDIKTITKGLEEYGDMTGEEWYGWMVVNIPSEYLTREEWKSELVYTLGIDAQDGDPGGPYRDLPVFSIDTYQHHHKDRTNVLITQRGGLDI